MKSNGFKTAVVVFGIMMISNISFGQPQDRKERKEPPTFSELLKEMDKNEDGKLSKSELKGPLKEDFAKVDTDEDGFITEEEFKKAPKPQRRKRN
ncbi:EF-hand domain-containing protein [Psychroserpens algicola]|uniref:EF-hand domain-containing protein n=1 Tax=Psychroserpens algicola TaxID=1719034 RepID=A0ABT0H522_9FLAO|nr:EF-hand domain-containing protein [Psychroserpens algicola]MCK8479468.1 EF-hand domain-containing protein [Psychroserpens algicola]